MINAEAKCNASMIEVFVLFICNANVGFEFWEVEQQKIFPVS